MRRVSSLAWLAGVAASGIVGTSCGGTVAISPSGGSGGGGSGAGSTSSSAASGNGPSSSSSSGGECMGYYAANFAACLQAPFFPWGPESGVITGVVSLGQPSINCMISGGGAELGNITVPPYGAEDFAADAVWFTIDTPEGPYVAGVAVEGFTAAQVPVGKVMEVRFVNAINEFATYHTHLELWTDGQPLVVAAFNSAAALAVEEGKEVCHSEDDVCGYGHHDMVVSYQGEQQTLSRGETAAVGGLLVTNDHYTHLYDLGACNFGDPIDMAYTAVRAPSDP